MQLLVAMLTAALVLTAASGADAACGKNGIAVQVLGSGGPIADSSRASSGYLVWVNGRARVLVDAGGGVFLRYGESGAKVEDLDLVAITHLHTDHVADLPALLKGATFSERRRALPVSGPVAGRRFPSMSQFMKQEFDAKTGAFRYLSGLLDGSEDSFQLRPVDVNTQTLQPTRVLDLPDLKVEAIGVPHGPVPALGYRVSAGGFSIVFSGDQNGSNRAFWKLAHKADLLVMAHAVPESADVVARQLHATPSTIGQGAADAGAQHLVLSHLMARSLNTLNDNLSIIRGHYSGPLDVAADLACYPMSIAER